MSKSAETIITQAMATRIAEEITGNEAFWDALEVEIQDQLKASRGEATQLWLSEDGNHKACVTIFGADEPYVTDFFVRDVDMPVHSSAVAQVEHALSQIAAIRRLCADLTAQANEAQAKLDAIISRR